MTIRMVAGSLYPLPRTCLRTRPFSRACRLELWLALPRVASRAPPRALQQDSLQLCLGIQPFLFGPLPYRVRALAMSLLLRQCLALLRVVQRGPRPMYQVDHLHSRLEHHPVLIRTYPPHQLQAPAAAFPTLVSPLSNFPHLLSPKEGRGNSFSPGLTLESRLHQFRILVVLYLRARLLRRIELPPQTAMPLEAFFPHIHLRARLASTQATHQLLYRIPREVTISLVPLVKIPLSAGPSLQTVPPPNDLLLCTHNRT